jgi:hypothetical protein
MITLKETGTFAEFFDRYGISRPTNTCQLFWKTALLSAVITAVGFTAGFYVLGAIFLFFPGYWHPTTIFFMMITGCGGILGSIYLIDRGINEGKFDKFIGRERTQWEKNFVEAYKGFKEKYCPIVSYKENRDA